MPNFATHASTDDVNGIDSSRLRNVHSTMNTAAQTEHLRLFKMAETGNFSL